MTLDTCWNQITYRRKTHAIGPVALAITVIEVLVGKGDGDGEHQHRQEGEGDAYDAESCFDGPSWIVLRKSAASLR